MTASFQKNVIKSLKKIGILGYRKKHNILGINPFFISTAYIVLTLLLAYVARKIVKTWVKDESAFKHLLLEFIATLELCACCFELIIVADNWGVTAYAVSLFLLTVWWSTKWENATACPYCPMEEILEGTKTIKSAIYIICAQLFGAFFTYRYVEILWSLELVETHKGKVDEECTADLQVDMFLGAIVEFTLTCLCRLASRILGEKEFKYGYILDALFCTGMVVLGFNFSGGYFNPALATSLKFGCDGHTFVEHIVVYWLGACAGSALSVFIFKINAIQKYCQKPKED